MIDYRDAMYLKHECEKLQIKVSIKMVDGAPVLNVMDGQYVEYGAALRAVQAYQAEQGARWLYYKQKTKPEPEVIS